MDCFENNSLLEGVQCSVYGVAQDIYDYAYSFAQGVDSIADSLIPKLPVVEAKNDPHTYMGRDLKASFGDNCARCHSISTHPDKVLTSRDSLTKKR